MKSLARTSALLSGLVLAILGGPVFGPVRAAPGEPIVLFETGFEASEGYDPNLELRFQPGWTGDGSGGNGILTNFFEGYGQQAYIGYAAPAYKDEFLNVWRPVEFAAPPVGWPVLKFSVLMQVVDSTNGQYDDFRWSVYNTSSQRLFTLDFDNWYGEIFYALEDNAFRRAGFEFRNDVSYVLEIYMNFARNNWQAILNGQVVVDSQPIRMTATTRLDLSDVDAVWALREKGRAGDNYLLFDEYWITAEPTQSIPPTLEIVGRRPAGEFELLLHGERGLTYAIDVTDEFQTEWFPLQTNTPPDGVWRYLDESAKDYPVSLYRARQVGR